MLTTKDAQMVADNHYNRGTAKNGLLTTIKSSTNAFTSDFLNRKFGISSAVARINEIEKETGIKFTRVSVQDGTNGVTTAYAA